jgi:hypothetical protein
MPSGTIKKALVLAGVHGVVTLVAAGLAGEGGKDAATVGQ